MIIMQYANNGSLLSYLDQNINKLTWKMKLQYLEHIATSLQSIHAMNLVHRDLHGGNIVLHNEGDYIQSVIPFICDFRLSKSMYSPSSDTTICGVLPYMAPEVLRTRKF